MTELNSSTSEKTERAKDASGSLPTAAVVQKRGLTESKFWLLTLVALLIAIGLAWWSMPPVGTKLRIRFPAGHGLHVGDAVRYRGINVGEVNSIELDDQLESIAVHVQLNPSASGLAREGTEFWIVRPTLGIGGVSGLDTAVGPKYIAVATGGGHDADDEMPVERTTEFQGLTEAPRHGDNDSGIEIVLRADQRHSVSAGSGVTFRGVEVGRVLDVGLSDDARFVDLRTRVFAPHHKLVTSETRFWANSGVDIDFSFRNGLSLDSESLDTIARGGVSFLTLKAGGQEAVAGQVFVLNEQPADDWVLQANKVRMPAVRLKGAVNLEVQQTRKGLLGRRIETISATGIPIRNSMGESGILLPTAIVWQLQDGSNIRAVRIDNVLVELSDLENKPSEPAIAVDGDSLGEPPLAFLRVPTNIKLSWQTLPDDFSSRNFSGDMVAVRRPAGADGNTFLHVTIAAENVTMNRDGQATVSGFDGDRELWNGSPVLSAEDGEIIGALSLTAQGATIISNEEIENLLSE